MKAPTLAVLLSLALSAPALAATFVYVSNAEDGESGSTRSRWTARCSRARASRPPRW